MELCIYLYMPCRFICEKSVKTEILAFLSYWYRKESFVDALLTGRVS